MTNSGGREERERGSDSHRELVERSLGRRARLVWTDNRSVYLSVATVPLGKADEVVVRLHRVFQTAPQDVWKSLGRFFSGGPKQVLGPARAHFEDWLGKQPERTGKEETTRRRALRPRGRCHDLGEILETVRKRHPFTGLPEVVISWGRRRKPGSVSVRLGSYRVSGGREGEGLICVHPVLDRESVPRFVVEHVIHHELVHHLFAVRQGPAAGRRHGAEFRRLERQFECYGLADHWIRKDLAQVLRAARRER